MSVMPYNYEADSDPITQEVETITPELADRIQARVLGLEPTPVQLVWVGLEQKAKQTRHWRTDVRGARKAARAQKRADDLHRTYLAVRKQPTEVGELAAHWDAYEEQDEKADDLYERHESVVRRRTTEMRLKASGCLAGAAYATSFIIPLRYGVLTFGTIGLAGGGVLWLRALYSMGSAQHRKHTRKRPTKPARPATSHLELVTDCAIEDDPDGESVPDWVPLFEDIMSVRDEGEEGIWTSRLLTRLQDQLPERYSYDLTEEQLSDKIRPVLRMFGLRTDRKPRMPKGEGRRGTKPCAGFDFDEQINAALERAGMA